MVKNTNWVPISVSIDLSQSIESFVNSKEGKKSGYTSKSGFVADAIREKLETLTGESKNKQTNVEKMLIELQDQMNLLIHMQEPHGKSKNAELSAWRKARKESEEYLKELDLKPYNFKKNRLKDVKSSKTEKKITTKS